MQNASMSVVGFQPAPPNLMDRVASWFATGAADASRKARPTAAKATAKASPAACPAMRTCGAAGMPNCRVAAELQAEQQRGREMERAFSQYVSPQVIERLMADPAGLSLGGETRDVTVLFADVRGFTALGEALKDNPGRLTQLIGAVMDPLTDIVLAHGGTIDKYMGDCVMAFWGAAGDGPDHADRALEAAQAMLAAMDEINMRLRRVFSDVTLPIVRIGIGLNSGPCVVGNLGSRKRFDYSVMGDPVNVASRLENLCKTYDVPLIVGEATVDRLGPDALLIELDRITLRGRLEPQAIFTAAPIF